MILDKILQQKIREVELAKQQTPIERIYEQLKDAPPIRKFSANLKQDERGIPAIIAEIKKASPSKGVIRSDFHPVEIAKTYSAAGVKAISVLTDEKFFQGSLEHLRQARKATDIPILRKDFIVDAYQIAEARAAGADAILLIAAALPTSKIIELAAYTEELGMEYLLETHNEEEIKMALQIGAKLIGVNNRNLQTFEVSLSVTERLAPLARGKTLVSESGIKTRDDLCKLGMMGVNAALIGETLMRHDNIYDGLRKLLN